jgi:hypothetical protein
LRKLIAIALLVVFGLPLASSLLALSPTSEANLPACCRKNGKHHCMMSLAEQRRQQGDKPGVAAPAEKCPYCPTALLNIHSQIDFMPQAGQAIYAGLVSHPAVIAQTECKLRIACDKSRGKRGPPPSSI